MCNSSDRRKREENDGCFVIALEQRARQGSDEGLFVVVDCEIQSQYAVGAAVRASPPCGGGFGVGFDWGRLVGRSLGLCLTGAKRWWMVQGPNSAKREADAALERVGHPIKLLFASSRLSAPRE